MSGGPTADVSVRVAWGDDAPAIAAVQVRAWAQMYDGVLPADALPDDVDALARAWREPLTRPADARQRVLVALERNLVVGFALTSPGSDPDTDPLSVGEVADLTVGPDHLRRGHGSRLLQAAVDTLVADRFTTAVSWVNAADDARRAFLQAAGWAPDSAHRELDLDGAGTTTVKQVRLHTDIRG